MIIIITRNECQGIGRQASSSRVMCRRLLACFLPFFVSSFLHAIHLLPYFVCCFPDLHFNLCTIRNEALTDTEHAKKMIKEMDASMKQNIMKNLHQNLRFIMILISLLLFRLLHSSFPLNSPPLFFHVLCFVSFFDTLLPFFIQMRFNFVVTFE